MPQLAIYVDDNLSKKLKKAIKASGKSRSKWVSDLIKAKLDNDWPELNWLKAGKVKRPQIRS
jgi:metal-responsive CopG/Arc/MetJ family transcriptional regulator